MKDKFKKPSSYIPFCVFLIFALPSFGQNAQLKWDEFKKGAEYASITKDTEDGRVRFYVVKIDLQKSGASVAVSPPSFIGSKTSKFAKAINADVAISGGFWTLITRKPLGLIVSGGRRWRDSKDDSEYGFIAFTKDAKAWISPPEKVVNSIPRDVVSVMAGAPMIVRGGKVGKVSGCGYICMKHPRAAVGIDVAGEKLFLVASDGRQSDSVSISLKTLAGFLIELGVWDALNLDGGGSVTLYVKEKGGVVNKPCEGQERAVMNSIGVILNSNEEGNRNISGVSQEDINRNSKIKVNGIVFGEEEFRNRGKIGFPPRVFHFAGIAGCVALFFALLIVSSVLTIMRRRKQH